MSEAAGIGSKYREKLSKVIRASKDGITSEIVAKTLNVNKQEAGRLLARWSKTGWLRRIKRGFYVSVPFEFGPNQLAIENPWVVVSKIFSPGYIGGFSAIKHWDLSEQIFETTVFFTTKKIHTREPKYSGLKIRLKSIDKSKLFGTKTVWFNSSKLLVSDPSKTIVDILDEPSIVGGMTIVRDFFQSYLDSEFKNINLLIEYAGKMKNETIFKRLGFLIELIMPNEKLLLDKIKKNISSGYSKFDPSVENKRIIKRWNLKVPVSWLGTDDRKK
jgi:predicted transcriptional regulator of viral defense system